MRGPDGDYADWLRVHYKPAIGEHTPHHLSPYLKLGQTALEIGCGAGSVCYFLAKHGVKALGIDINAVSIAEARSREKTTSPGWPRFEVSDILTRQLRQAFDLVLMIRVLTCFSDKSAWHETLARARESLKPGGLIWIHDFLSTPDSPIYGPRYERAVTLGMRPGNFLVESDGKTLFVAHHHSDPEILEITEPYETLSLASHDSVSMNGNACRMFRFLGRRPL
jgi:2-polyprenyl-3-methyl-5-hydroxy-6-metoxy-1,4-benzoquinol methylase